MNKNILIMIIAVSYTTAILTVAALILSYFYQRNNKSKNIQNKPEEMAGSISLDIKSSYVSLSSICADDMVTDDMVTDDIKTNAPVELEFKPNTFIDKNTFPNMQDSGIASGDEDAGDDLNIDSGCCNKEDESELVDSEDEYVINVQKICFDALANLNILTRSVSSSDISIALSDIPRVKIKRSLSLPLGLDICCDQSTSIVAFRMKLSSELYVTNPLFYQTCFIDDLSDVEESEYSSVDNIINNVSLSKEGCRKFC